MDRIEEKVLRTGSEQIYKLNQMEELRRKVDTVHLIDIDKFSDGTYLTIMDSSKLIGARYILDYI